MERLGGASKHVIDAAPFSQLGRTNRRMNSRVSETRQLGEPGCVCGLALSSRPIALHATIGDQGDTVAAYFPGIGATPFRPSDRCEIPCSSELAEPLVINVTKLVLAICRSISHIQETNAPSEEVRVHFTDVWRPHQQFLTCTVKWTYPSQDEIE